MSHVLSLPPPPPMWLKWCSKVKCAWGSRRNSDTFTHSCKWTRQNWDSAESERQLCLCICIHLLLHLTEPQQSNKPWCRKAIFHSKSLHRCFLEPSLLFFPAWPSWLLSIQETVSYIWNEEQLTGQMTGSGDGRSLLAGVNRWALNNRGSVVSSQHAG